VTLAVWECRRQEVLMCLKVCLRGFSFEYVPPRLLWRLLTPCLLWRDATDKKRLNPFP